jgi:hypothetical protein
MNATTILSTTPQAISLSDVFSIYLLRFPADFATMIIASPSCDGREFNDLVMG